jgi:hypothetical protein
VGVGGGGSPPLRGGWVEELRGGEALSYGQALIGYVAFCAALVFTEFIALIQMGTRNSS